MVKLVTWHFNTVEGKIVAQKVQYLLLCDLHDGNTAGVETLAFGLDGTSYELDLCKKHAKEVRDTIDRYVSSARKVRSSQRGRGRTRSRSNGSVAGASTTDIRTWAMDQGYEVGERGRIPTAVVEAYKAAH